MSVTASITIWSLQTERFIDFVIGVPLLSWAPVGGADYLIFVSLPDFSFPCNSFSYSASTKAFKLFKLLVQKTR